jgi:hypothetical protein
VFECSALFISFCYIIMGCPTWSSVAFQEQVYVCNKWLPSWVRLQKCKECIQKYIYIPLVNKDPFLSKAWCFILLLSVASGHKPTDHFHTTGAKISEIGNICKQWEEIVKVKFCLCQSTMPTRQTRGKALFILKFSIRWSGAVTFILWPPYPQRKLTQYQLVIANQTLPTVSIALLTQLSWLTVKGMTSWHVMCPFLLRYVQRILILNMGS